MRQNDTWFVLAFLMWLVSEVLSLNIFYLLWILCRKRNLLLEMKSVLAERFNMLIIFQHIVCGLPNNVLSFLIIFRCPVSLSLYPLRLEGIKTPGAGGLLHIRLWQYDFCSIVLPPASYLSNTNIKCSFIHSLFVASKFKWEIADMSVLYYDWLSSWCCRLVPAGGS